MKTHARRGRLARNLFASILSKGLLTARQLFLVPLFLQAWGVQTYGQYVILAAIPSVLAMSNLGMGTAAGVRLALEVAGDKIKEANRTFVAGMAVVCAVGGLLTAIAATVPWFWPKVATSFPALGNPQIILTFLILSLVSDLPNAVLLGIFNGTGRAAEGLQVANATQFVRLCVMAIMLLAKQSPVVVVVCDALINIAATTFMVWKSLRCCPALLKHGIHFDRSIVRELFFTGLGFQASPLWQAILFQGSLWLANLAMGAVGAATWATLRALARSQNQIFAMINQTIFPELQLAIGKKDFETARRFHGLAVYISGVVGAVICIPFALAGPPIYEVWTQGKLDVPYAVWPLLALTGLSSGLWWTSAVVHRAMNRPWLMNLTGVGAAVASVLAMYVLSFQLKIVGFAIGGLLFEVLMALTVLNSSLRLLDDNIVDMLRRANRDFAQKITRRLAARRQAA